MPDSWLTALPVQLLQYEVNRQRLAIGACIRGGVEEDPGVTGPARY